MQKNIFIFWGLVIIIFLSLLAGCTAYSTTSPSSAPLSQNSNTTSQVVNTNSQPTPPTLIQNTLPSEPALSATAPTSVSSAQNVVVNMPSFADLLNVAEHLRGGN